MTRYVRCAACRSLYYAISAAEARAAIAGFNDRTITFESFLSCRICGADSGTFENVEVGWAPLTASRPFVVER